MAKLGIGLAKARSVNPLALLQDDGEVRRAPSVVRALRLGRTRVGLGMTAVVIAFAIIGPYVAPYSQTAFVGVPFAGPSSHAVLGTDFLGHDVLTEVLYGGRTILWMAFAAASLGVAIGAGLGMVAGYSRGVVDQLIMRTLDLQLAFPGLIFVLLFVSMLGHHLWLIVILVALTHVPPVARVTYGVTSEISTRDFVAAARVIGVARRHILTREVLPNLSTPLLVEYSLRLTWAISGIAAISFLGFGVQPPASDWGLMVNQNRDGLTVAPWGVAAPILCVALFAIGTNLIGEGVSRVVAGTSGQTR